MAADDFVCIACGFLTGESDLEKAKKEHGRLALGHKPAFMTERANAVRRGKAYQRWLRGKNG